MVSCIYQEYKMALISKVTNITNEYGKLTVEEYEFLFSLIRAATFKGESLEFVYNLTAKLQEQYLELKTTRN